MTYTSNTGETAIDVFAYEVSDGTETASAQVVVRVVGEFADDIAGDVDDNVLAAGEGSDRIDGGLGSDFLAGLAGGDLLLGGDGDDYLMGGSGDDTIVGGAGKDTMYGGRGTNVFVFGDGDLGAEIGDTDEITAFGVLGNDFLDFSGIDAIAGGDDDAFTFIGEADFSGTAGELRFERNGANTDIFGDIDGDGLADIALRLYGNVALDASALIT